MEPYLVPLYMDIADLHLHGDSHRTRKELGAERRKGRVHGEHDAENCTGANATYRMVKELMRSHLTKSKRGDRNRRERDKEPH